MTSLLLLSALALAETESHPECSRFAAGIEEICCFDEDGVVAQDAWLWVTWGPIEPYEDEEWCDHETTEYLLVENNYDGTVYDDFVAARHNWFQQILPPFRWEQGSEISRIGNGPPVYLSEDGPSTLTFTPELRVDGDPIELVLTRSDVPVSTTPGTIGLVTSSVAQDRWLDDGSALVEVTFDLEDLSFDETAFIGIVTPQDLVTMAKWNGEATQSLTSPEYLVTDNTSLCLRAVLWNLARTEVASTETVCHDVTVRPPDPEPPDVPRGCRATPPAGTTVLALLGLLLWRRRAS